MNASDMTPHTEHNHDRRNRISVLVDEITATTRELLAKGVDPGHAIDKRESLKLVKRITEQAYRAGVA